MVQSAPAAPVEIDLRIEQPEKTSEGSVPSSSCNDSTAYAPSLLSLRT
jgi:hypothetical protein